MPRGSAYTTIMELGPQNHNGDGLLGPNSIIVVYMDPLGCYQLVKYYDLCVMGVGVNLRGLGLSEVSEYMIESWVVCFT